MNLREQLQQTLGSGFVVERELGGGGMSRVFVANDTALDRKIVVKVLPPELTAGVNVERFNREILLAAKLQHPHIVPVLNAGEMDGLPWYTMPFVEGESVRARLDRGGALSIVEIVGILEDVSKALAYAHERGIVHRDIKPDNVLLTGGTATVADFGIAKAISASRAPGGTQGLTQVGTSIGTPVYMSPEQAAGDPGTDHRADLYSFGCVAFELLTGRPPFIEKSPQRLLASHMSERPQSVTELRLDTPSALAELVMRCLEKEADDRPQTASDLVRVLESVTTGDGSQAAMPAMLLGGVGMLRKALMAYAVSFGAVAIIAKAAIVGVGLPDWVFPGALIVMALGLPVILWTAYVHRVTKRAFASTPQFTPGGTPSMVQGTMATIALKASPHMSWQRTARGGFIAMAAFVGLITVFMTLRALGIGPEGSLFAAGSLDERDRLVMTDFTVSGADSSLGRVVSDAVRSGLAQSRVLSLLSPADVAGALQRMERPPTGRVDLVTARALAEREGVKAIVDGDVTTVGSTYIVSVRLVTADSGTELTSYRATAAGATAIIDVADELSRKLRARVGESLRSVNGAPPLARVTTASLGALRKYSEGARANDVETDYPKAARLLREAVANDTLFAEAWRKLGVALANFGEWAASDSARARAFSLRHRLPDRDRDLVAASYYADGPRRDRAKAMQTYEQLLARGDSDLVLNNLGLQLTGRREHARAEALLRASIRLTPGSSLEYQNLAYGFAFSGRLREADSVLAVLRSRVGSTPTGAEFTFIVKLLRDDVGQLQSALDSASKVPALNAVGFVQPMLVTLARQAGRVRLADARISAMRIADSAGGRPISPRRDAAMRLDTRVRMRLPFAAELRAYETTLERIPIASLPLAERDYFRVAEMLAQAGRAERAKAVLAQYRSEIRDTAQLRAQASELDRAAGAVAQAEGRWADAARAYRASELLPDGPTGPDHVVPWLLFDLFAQAGMADSALASYEVYRRSPLGSRERNGPDLMIDAHNVETLAKMYEQVGDTTRAVESYRDFIERWKGADPELQPRVAAARERLRMLTPVERPRR